MVEPPRKPRATQRQRQASNSSCNIRKASCGLKLDNLYTGVNTSYDTFDEEGEGEGEVIEGDIREGGRYTNLDARRTDLNQDSPGVGCFRKSYDACCMDMGMTRILTQRLLTSSKTL